MNGIFSNSDKLNDRRPWQKAEWFADYSLLGKVEIAKLYSQIERVCEKNLELFLEGEVDNEIS